MGRKLHAYTHDVYYSCVHSKYKHAKYEHSKHWIWQSYRQTDMYLFSDRHESCILRLTCKTCLSLYVCTEHVSLNGTPPTPPHLRPCFQAVWKYKQKYNFVFVYHHPFLTHSLSRFLFKSCTVWVSRPVIIPVFRREHTNVVFIRPTVDLWQ